MTDAVLGKGTLLKAGDGAGTEVFTAIAEVKSISGPDITRDTVDVTHMESSGNFREYISTLQDGGTMNFDINYIGDNTTQNNLKADMDAGTARNFQLLMPNTGATLFTFTALVVGFSFNFDIESLISASISLKITGVVTITP